jgi:hypothetical protein
MWITGGLRLGRATYLHGVLVDDLFIGLGVALLIVDIPSEGLEERVQELLAELDFVVA